MISCDYAHQTVNLYYGVIKFVAFRGIVWAGDSLPLVLNSLGDIHQIQVELSERQGRRVRDVTWRMGMLHAPFQAGRIYDLALRLEYHLPPRVDRFLSDFDSIHPRDYRVGLDFSTSHVQGSSSDLAVVVGPRQFRFPIAREEMRHLDSGHRFKLVRERDFCSASLEIEGDAPFSHRYFPIFSLG